MAIPPLVELQNSGAGCRQMPGTGESKSLALFHQTPHFQNREDNASAERGNRKH